MKTSQSITPEIKKAIWDWYQKEKLTQPEIAKLIGVKNPSVNQWLNGIAKNIRPKNWEKLYPYIKEYLPKNYKISITGDNVVGVNHGVINHNCQLELENLKRNILDAIMQGDLDEVSKVKAYNIINNVKP